MLQKRIKLKTTDGYSIAATHTISQGSGVVLWLHGIGVDKDEYLGMFKDGARLLAENGIDSLRIDFRGHGKSSGKSADFTIAGQMVDVDAAIEYLKKHYSKHHDRLKLEIVGCSFGAPPALFSSCLYGDIVASITLIAPVLSYRRTFIVPETEWAKEIFSAKKVEKLYKTNRLPIDDNFSLGIKLYREMQIIYPDKVLENVVQRINIIHGDSDSIVPYTVSKELAARHSNIFLQTVQNMDHGFNDADDEIGDSPESIANKMLIFNTILSQIQR